MEALRVLLTDLAPFFARIDSALEKPQLVWRLGSRDTIEDLAQPPSHIRRLQTLNWLLQARAVSDTIEDERIAGYRSSVRLASRAHSVTQLEQLVAAVLFGIPCGHLRVALEEPRSRPTRRRAVDSKDAAS